MSPTRTTGGKGAFKERPRWLGSSPGGTGGALAYGRSGMALECAVANAAMGYEGFYEGFSDEAVGTWQTPRQGTPERRSGEPQDFMIVYSGGGTSGTSGHLIVQTEEEKFTFTLAGCPKPAYK